MQEIQMRGFRKKLVADLKAFYSELREKERDMIQNANEGISEGFSLPALEPAAPHTFITSFEEIFDEALADNAKHIEQIDDGAISGQLKTYKASDGFVVQIEVAETMDNGMALMNFKRDANVLILSAQRTLDFEKEQTEDDAPEQAEIPTDTEDAA